MDSAGPTAGHTDRSAWRVGLLIFKFGHQAQQQGAQRLELRWAYQLCPAMFHPLGGHVGDGGTDAPRWGEEHQPRAGGLPRMTSGVSGTRLEPAAGFQHREALRTARATQRSLSSPPVSIRSQGRTGLPGTLPPASGGQFRGQIPAPWSPATRTKNASDLRSPLTESNRRPSPYHVSLQGSAAPGRWLDLREREHRPAPAGIRRAHTSAICHSVCHSD